MPISIDSTKEVNDVDGTNSFGYITLSEYPTRPHPLGHFIQVGPWIKPWNHLSLLPLLPPKQLGLWYLFTSDMELCFLLKSMLAMSLNLVHNSHFSVGDILAKAPFFDFSSELSLPDISVSRFYYIIAKDCSSKSRTI
jgi:hypothetical protein